MNSVGGTNTVSKINGINLETVRLAQDQMRKEPDGDVASPVHAATIVWETGYQTRTGVSGGTVVRGDEPKVYGGSGNGATPQELLLTAVGHCLAATYVGGLSASGIELRKLEIKVQGKVNFRAAYGVDREASPGFDGIQIDVEVDANAPKETVLPLLEKLFRTAPIPDTIIRPVPVNVDINISDSEEERQG
jgi:uncharacterized OsmC-like protein